MDGQPEEPPASSGTTPWWQATRDQDAFERAQQVLARPMTVLALVFTVGLVLDLRGDLDPTATTAVLITNVLIWLAFAAEYLWLLRLSPDRRRFVRTHVLDLVVVVLPMLRPLRALRVLRLVAVALRSWHQVFSVLRHRGLGKIISSVGALMIVGGLITFALEPQTFGTLGDAVWWVLVTSTTVGYGDFAPVTTGARAVAVVVMILGIGLVGVVTANIVDFMMTEGVVGAPARRAGSGPDVELPPGEPATGAVDEPAPAGCAGCAEVAQRLQRIEVQLAQLLDAPPPSTDRDPIDA